MSAKKENAAIVGVGVAACAVCCAGPILGFLAAIGIGAAAGFARFGLIGLAIAAVVGVVFSRRRQRRRSTCTPAPQTVEIDAPRVRTRDEGLRASVADPAGRRDRVASTSGGVTKLR